MIEKKPFIQKHTENTNADKRMVSLKLSDDEKRMIHDAQYILRQVKVGTTIKQLMKLGYESITRPENAKMLELIFGNYRRNRKTGIIDIMPEIEKGSQFVNPKV